MVCSESKFQVLLQMGVFIWCWAGHEDLFARLLASVANLMSIKEKV